MPSHLLRLHLIVSAILLNSFLAVWAEDGKNETRSAMNETQPKLTAANQLGVERARDYRIAEKSDDSAAQKAVAEGRRTYTARLYGSLCVSCMKQLNDELNKRKGVLESTIERPVKKEAHDGQPATYQRWANAKVVYDAEKISKDDITKRIKASDFIVRRVEDVGENELNDKSKSESNDESKSEPNDASRED